MKNWQTFALVLVNMRSYVLLLVLLQFLGCSGELLSVPITSYRDNLTASHHWPFTFQASLYPTLSWRLWQKRLSGLLWQKSTLCTLPVVFTGWLTALSQEWVTTISFILKITHEFADVISSCDVYSRQCVWICFPTLCVCHLWDYDKYLVCARLFPQARAPVTWCWHLALRRQTVPRPPEVTHRHAPTEQASLWWGIQCCVLVCLVSEGCSLIYKKGRKQTLQGLEWIVFTWNDITWSDMNANCSQKAELISQFWVGHVLTDCCPLFALAWNPKSVLLWCSEAGGQWLCDHYKTRIAVTNTYWSI